MPRHSDAFYAPAPKSRPPLANPLEGERKDRRQFSCEPRFRDRRPREGSRMATRSVATKKATGRFILPVASDGKGYSLKLSR